MSNSPPKFLKGRLVVQVSKIHQHRFFLREQPLSFQRDLHEITKSCILLNRLVTPIMGLEGRASQEVKESKL